ncbi:MAG: hypothetical protein SFV24_01650 [Gemmatimonadales bacterium]|nr:hypothetical protein [Gemmatimonadota bacterium]MDX2056480.1 hypothetical protein [Gemmatimonadales bacterium]
MNDLWTGAMTLFLSAAPMPTAQEVWQADVRIETLDVSVRQSNLAIQVVVTSDHDDDARGVRLEVLLPVGVGLVAFPTDCRPSPSPVANLVGRITCDLGTIPVRGSRSVQLTATRPPAGGGRRISAFAASDTPDPDPSNNHAIRSLP